MSALTKEDGNALWDHYRRLSDRAERSIKRYKLSVESSNVNRSRMRETRRKLRKALDMLDSARRTVKTAIKSELKQQLGARKRLQQAADKSQEVADEATERVRAAKKKWSEAKKARAHAAALHHAAKVALQTEPSSSERLARKSETKQAKRANAAYQTALTELRTAKDQMKSALKEATERDAERAQSTREARRNQERLADIRDLERREPRLVSLSTTHCDSPQDCPTLPNTRCLYSGKKRALRCSNGCDEGANKLCRSKGVSFGCRAKVREEDGDGLPFKCVDVCAGSSPLCAGERENTECYADDATHPAVAKCRNPCLIVNGPAEKQCRSQGDVFGCRPKAPNTVGDALPFMCVNLCWQNLSLCEAPGTTLTDCYADHATLPAVAKCRNPCLTIASSERCHSFGDQYACVPKLRDRTQDWTTSKCANLCMRDITLCARERENTECYVDRATLPEVAKCRNPCLTVSNGSPSKQCRSKGDAFACVPRGQVGNPDGTRFSCVDLCAGNLALCAGEGENRTECYADHTTYPAVTKCRNPCISAANEEQCRSKGDTVACRTKPHNEGGDGLPFTCVDLCAENPIPCASERVNSECYADRTTLPAVLKCRNPCYTVARGSPDEQCRLTGDSFVCYPKPRDEGGDGKNFKCLDLCPPAYCAYSGDNTECVAVREKPGTVTCRNPCNYWSVTRHCRIKHNKKTCKSITTRPFFECV